MTDNTWPTAEEMMRFREAAIDLTPEQRRLAIKAAADRLLSAFMSADNDAGGQVYLRK